VSTANRIELAEQSTHDGVLDIPNNVGRPSATTEQEKVLAEYSLEKRMEGLRLLASSGMTSGTPPPCSGVVPQMTANDIPTDEELKKANRPERKPDPKTKAQRAAAAKNGYVLRDGSERQDENYALTNAVQSSKWPNVTSESFEIVSDEEYNEGYNGDPNFFKNNIWLRCLVCLQLIKAHKSIDSTNLANINRHAGPCAELKRTGKMKNGKCACNATKDHEQFKGKGPHAFCNHAKDCHGNHCPKCGKDFDNWTSRLCKKPKVLSFKERQDHVNDKKIKAHKEWEEEQKKRD